MPRYKPVPTLYSLCLTKTVTVIKSLCKRRRHQIKKSSTIRLLNNYLVHHVPTRYSRDACS